MGMTLHKLSAGKGYQYLTNSIASGDNQRKPGQSLSNYYAGEHGTPPGQWWGKGAQILGVNGYVTEEQMKFLYGQGMHPDAENRIKEQIKTGKSFKEARKNQYLGTRYALYEQSKNNVVKRIIESQQDREKEIGRLLTEEEESTLGMEIATREFETQFGRLPQDKEEVERWIWSEEKKTRTSNAGYDLTFSAPKSISILWALGDEKTRQCIEEAHDKAVCDSLTLLENEAAFSRVGHGTIQIDTEGLTVAQFMHYDTRAGDMDLHTHCTVSNKVLCTDGKWRALDGRALFHLSAVAGSEYNAILINELRNQLGVTFRPVDHGPNKQPVLEIAGISEKLIEQFSKRSQDIDKIASKLINDYRKKYGKEPDEPTKIRFRQQANLESRTSKGEPHSFNEIQKKWIKEAANILSTAPNSADISAQLDTDIHSTNYSPEEFNPQEIIASALSHTSAKRAHWRVGHLRASINHELMRCHFVDDQQRKAAQKECEKHALTGYSVALPASGRAHSICTERLTKTNGESIFHTHMSQEYATPEIVLCEKNILDAVESPCAEVLTREETNLAIATVEEQNGYPLNSGQQDLVHHFTGCGTLVAAGIGPAGTGKTTAMRAVSDAWRSSGRSVLALGTSAAAAQILGKELNVHHSTIADLLTRYTNNISIPVTAGTMLLVDEAGMSSTKELAKIVDLARERGAVVRLLGDPRQVNAVESGGILSTITERWDCPELQRVVRFKDAKEAEASMLVRSADPAAVDFYARNNRLHCGDVEVMENAAVSQWMTDIQAGKDTILLGNTNAIVSELNSQAQCFARESGRLNSKKDSVITHSGEELYVGDVVMTTLNQHIRGTNGGDVRNRNRWVITDIHKGAVTVQDLDNMQRVVRLPRSYANRHVVLGYALTVDKAQGVTCESSYAVVDPDSVTSNRLYVALTRGKETNEVFFAEPTMMGMSSDDEHEKAVYLSEPADIMREIITRRSDPESVSSQIAQSTEDYLSRENAHARFAKEQQLLLGDYAEYLISTRLDASLTDALCRSDEDRRALISATVERLSTGVDVGREFSILTGMTGVGKRTKSADNPLHYFLSAQNRLFSAAGTLKEGRSWVLPPVHPGQDSALLEAARKDFYLGQFSDLTLRLASSRELEAARGRFAVQQNELFRQWAHGVISTGELTKYGVNKTVAAAVARDSESCDALAATIARLAQQGVSVESAIADTRRYNGDKLQSIGRLDHPAAGLSSLLVQSVEYPKVVRHMAESDAPRWFEYAFNRCDAATQRDIVRRICRHSGRGSTLEAIYKAIDEENPELYNKLLNGEIIPSQLPSLITLCQPERTEMPRDNAYVLPEGKTIDRELLDAARETAATIVRCEAQIQVGDENPYMALSEEDLKCEVVKLTAQHDTLSRHGRFYRDLAAGWRSAPLRVEMSEAEREVIAVSDRIRDFQDMQENLETLEASLASFDKDSREADSRNDRLAARELYRETQEKIGWVKRGLAEKEPDLPTRDMWEEIECKRDKIDARQAKAFVADLTSQDMVRQLAERAEEESVKVDANLIAVRAAAAQRDVSLERTWISEQRTQEDKWKGLEQQAQDHFKELREKMQYGEENGEDVMSDIGAGAVYMSRAEQLRIMQTESAYRRYGDAAEAEIVAAPDAAVEREPQRVPRGSDIPYDYTTQASDYGMDL